MKYIKLLIIIIATFSLVGCVSYMELNELGIIDMLLIDKENDEFVVTINISTPTKNELESSKTYQTQNTSLEECFNELYLSTNKKISFSHLELVAFSPNIHKEDYDEIMNLFLNRTDSRNTFSVILFEGDDLFTYKSQDINELININHEEYGTVKIKQFADIIKDILEMNISYVPAITINEEPTILGYQSIYEDNNNLSLEEGIGYNFITNQINQARFHKSDIGFKIDTSNTNIKIDNNLIKIEVTSSYQVISNDSNIKDEKQINDIFRQAIRDYIEAFIANNQFNYFYNLCEKYDYQYYKNTEDIKLKFDIKIDATRIDKNNKNGGNYFEKQ